MELDLIVEEVFTSNWWIWSKCINFWSRYEFFCSYDNKKKGILVLGYTYTNGRKNVLD